MQRSNASRTTWHRQNLATIVAIVASQALVANADDKMVNIYVDKNTVVLPATPPSHAALGPTIRRQILPQVVRCVRLEKTTDPAVLPSTKLLVDVNRDGKVTTMTAAPELSQQLRACITASANKIRFPAFVADYVLDIPFDLEQLLVPNATSGTGGVGAVVRQSTDGAARVDAPTASPRKVKTTLRTLAAPTVLKEIQPQVDSNVGKELIRCLTTAGNNNPNLGWGIWDQPDFWLKFEVSAAGKVVRLEKAFDDPAHTCATDAVKGLKFPPQQRAYSVTMDTVGGAKMLVRYDRDEMFLGDLVEGSGAAAELGNTLQPKRAVAAPTSKKPKPQQPTGK